MEQIRDNRWFEHIKHNQSSQHGEDGIIDFIFKQIGVTNKWVVECGALDGTRDSNARTLITEKDWRGLLIEGDLTAFERLQRNFSDYPKAQCVNRFISFTGTDRVDMIFAEHKLPTDFDLFVLDIDGNDYHVWDAMETYMPRVMVVEFNETIPNSVSFIQPKDMQVQQGSSARALTELATKKGYRLVAITTTNVFFVRDDVVAPFSHLQNDLDTLRPHNPSETIVYQLYDGTLKIAGNTQLLWHQTPITEEAIQVLPKSKRFFPNGINANPFVRTVKYWGRKSILYPVIKKVRKITFFRRLFQ